MSKLHSSTTKSPRKQKTVQVAASSIPSYSSLNQLSQDKIAAWFRATSTSEGYKRYVKEGKEWLKKWAMEIKEGKLSPEESWMSSELSSSFDVIGEATPKALHAFVVYKCEVLDTSYKTAEAIRSAFKHYFT
jgi:hypothetical protein